MTDPGRPISPPVLLEIGARLPVWEYLRRLWVGRDFLLQMPRSHLRAQTLGTALGGVWHVLNPLMYAALYYAVFGLLFQADRAVDNYAGFLIVGLFAFLFTSRTVIAGANSITSNVTLISQVRFPRVALPLAATAAEVVSHTVALAALLGLLLLLGETPTAAWLLLPIVVGMQTIFNLGLALVAARMAFHFRDIQNFLPHLLRFWMYGSGVFFTTNLLAERVDVGSHLLTAFQLNPAYVFVTLTRGALLDGQAADAWLWTTAAGWALLSVVAGFLFFRAREAEYSGG
jgi:teichoic acid transport system permease protein